MRLRDTIPITLSFYVLYAKSAQKYSLLSINVLFTSYIVDITYLSI
jgi:hypothetical protein